MKCRRCHNSDATFYIAGLRAGSEVKIGFCDRCADEAGVFSALQRVETLLRGYGVEGGASPIPVGDGLPIEFAESCNDCGMELKTFERDFEFGCAECSHVFGSIIYNYAALLNPAAAKDLTLYRGAPPPSHVRNERVGKMQMKLGDTVGREDYRAAAKLRDEIVKIEDGERDRKTRSLRNVTRTPERIHEADEKFIAELAASTALPDGTDNWLETRVELRRNLADFFFPSRMDSLQRGFFKRYAPMLFPEKQLAGRAVVTVDRLSAIERGAVESALIGRRLSRRSSLIARHDGERILLLNDKDHLTFVSRDQCRAPEDALDAVRSEYKHVERRAEFAFNRRYGFLTASPAHLGTGLTVSVLLHVPHSLLLDDPITYQERAYKEELSFEPLSGRIFEKHGFVRIGSRVSFGASEEQIVNAVFTFAEKMIERENQLRETNRAEVAARIKRRMPGVLENATRSFRLTYQDILRLTSFLALGVEYKIIKWPGFSFRDIIPAFSSPQIMFADGVRYTVNECEKRRAELFAEFVESRDQ